jgi:hypothetical protein
MVSARFPLSNFKPRTYASQVFEELRILHLSFASNTAGSLAIGDADEVSSLSPLNRTGDQCHRIDPAIFSYGVRTPSNWTSSITYYHQQ